jgi:hypothetical protein
MLAGSIGSRPCGTDANRRAREYIVDRLRLYGFDVRVQQTDAVRDEIGQTARVANVIAVRAGPEADAIALVSHYDSPPESPGAADAGLGVAVCLEAARVLAARADRRHALIVLLTDGEELGLMGAAALVKDPIFPRVRAYLNFEAVGSSGPSLLFQAGPGNAWLAAAWAKHATNPRGSSLATEIYRRLPNDTDFTVLARTGTPGLNFAPIGDTYTYHTPRDIPERLSAATLSQTGHNAIAIVEALDRMDLSRRSDETPVFYDLGGGTGFAYGPLVERIVTVVALLIGIVAWGRILLAARRLTGLLRLLLTAVWYLLGVMAVAGAMVGAARLFRASRETWHPWYAQPDRFFTFLVLVGLAAGWLLVRVSGLVPARFRASAHPAFVWTVTLPVWLVSAALASWYIPGASHMATLPLLAAAVLLAGVNAEHADAVRIASIVALGTAGVLWIDHALQTLRFAVGVFGRLPIITPVVVYPALLFVAGIFIAPPLLAVVSGRGRGWARGGTVTWAILLAASVAAGVAWMAPAYSDERPEHRSARYVHDVAAGRAYWEVAASEPGLDLLDGMPEPGQWDPVNDQPPVGVPLGPLGAAFIFRARASLLESPPARASSTVAIDGDAARLEVTVLPAEEGEVMVFALPPGLRPLASNLAGAVRNGRWRAVYAAVPQEGVTLRASFPSTDVARLGEVRAVVFRSGLPGGTGWQRLPRWLPQNHAVWQARSVFVMAPGIPSQ